MEFGVHLPLLGWGDERFDLSSFTEYVRAADRLGFTAVSATTICRSAGVQRVFLWPIDSPVEQLELFREKVSPLLSHEGSAGLRTARSEWPIVFLYPTGPRAVAAGEETRGLAARFLAGQAPVPVAR